MCRPRSLRARFGLEQLELRRCLNGSLDVAFDGDGRQLIDFESFPGVQSMSTATGVVVQGDGKILVAGRTPRRGGGLTGGEGFLLLARIGPGGQLDPTFGNQGKAAMPVPGGATGDVVVLVRPDGKILLVSGSGTGAMAVARFEANGAPDLTFDADGLATVAEAVAVGDAALTPDGGLVVAATSHQGRVQVAKIRPDGSLDPTFGEGGLFQETPPIGAGLSGSDARAVAVQADGRILVGYDGWGDRFGVLRLSAGGTLDATFGSGGRAAADFGDVGGSIQDLAIQADGRIVLAGDAGGSMAVARLDASGAADTSFDGDGLATVAFDAAAVAYAVAVDGSGRIVLAGTTSRSSTLEPQDDFAAVRLTPAGSLDPSFGSGGRVAVDFASGEVDTPTDQALAMALQPADGKIVLVGESSLVSLAGSPRLPQFAVARLNTTAPPEPPGDGDPVSPPSPAPDPPGTGWTPPRIRDFRGLDRDRAPRAHGPTPAAAPSPISLPPRISWARIARGSGRRAVVTLGLDSPARRGPASRAQGYSLLSAGEDGRLGTVDDRMVPVVSAGYDGAARTVTLRTRGGSPGPFRLVVRAGTLVSPGGAAAGASDRILG